MSLRLVLLKIRLVEETLPSESSDALTGDSSDGQVLANTALEFLSNSEEDDQETEQNPGYSGSCSENKCCINITVESCMRAIGHGSRNFEPWLSDKHDSSYGTLLY
ncbi:hypothetical protein TNCV_1191341 [Trichonephila clavipes]|nr:hypothetical protein TNCV_1191341 [Trichonephila clavipes]